MEYYRYTYIMRHKYNTNATLILTVFSYLFQINMKSFKLIYLI